VKTSGNGPTFSRIPPAALMKAAVLPADAGFPAQSESRETGRIVVQPW
jgi:hypothetical protein